MDASSANDPRPSGDSARFREAYDRACRVLGAIPGVVTVGYGLKESGGELLERMALLVYVREKVPDQALPPAERVPREFDGWPTDVVVVPAAEATVCVNQAAYPVIRGGIQIVSGVNASDGAYSPGTLGCIVRRRGDAGRENVYLLTCKHVLYARGAHENDYVYHPFAPPPRSSIPASGPSTGLGPIQPHPLRENISLPSPSNPGRQVYLDCAIARINIDSKCGQSTCTADQIHYDPSIIEMIAGAGGVRADAQPTGVRSLLEADPAHATISVCKVGRTTGATTGRVVKVNGAIELRTNPEDPDSPTFTAVGLIEIDYVPADEFETTNCLGHLRFAEEGDSGSIVVDGERRVVGLVCAKASDPVSGTPTRAHRATFACHIVPVLDRMGVCIPTAGGTEHGCCGATDGSGTAPGPASTTGGAIGGSLSLAAPSRATPAIPSPVTAAAQARILALRDALRETPSGRGLHESFARLRMEVGYLVRNVRPVKVAWHRAEGPAFLAHVLNHVHGETESIPLAVNGVTRGMMLERMAGVLAAHGSNPLRETILRDRDALLPILSTAATVDECIARLRELDEEDTDRPYAGTGETMLAHPVAGHV